MAELGNTTTSNIIASSGWDNVTVGLVTFNSSKVISDCLVHIKNAKKVILVDNASDDNTCIIAKQVRPDIEIISNSRNYGFGAAINQAFEKVETTFGLLLNPDAVLDDDALISLLKIADVNPKAGIVAPLLYDEKGQKVVSLMGPSEHTHHPMSSEIEGLFCTWFTTGAVWLCRLDIFRKLGGFNESIFLYNEDAEYCLRMTRENYHILICPDARAFHRGGTSVEINYQTRWLKDWHMTWSHLYVEKIYGVRKSYLKQAFHILIKRCLMGILYLGLLRPSKVIGNFAKASAAFTFLIGGKSWGGKSKSHL